MYLGSITYSKFNLKHSAQIYRFNQNLIIYIYKLMFFYLRYKITEMPSYDLLTREKSCWNLPKTF